MARDSCGAIHGRPYEQTVMMPGSPRAKTLWMIGYGV
jgi:hypothetical protein